MDRFDEMRARGKNAILQTKNATPTAAGVTVTPDTGYDGLSQVNVTGDANLVAENIAEDVTIFGVTGTFSGGEGYPLERIGTTVTVEAQGAIGEGQPWEGVLNDEYAQQTLGKQNTGLNSERICICADRKVAIDTNSNTSRYKTIYFLNEDTSTYETISVDIGNTESNNYYWCLNRDGNLAVGKIYSSDSIQNDMVVIEIDKSNKTGTAYRFTTPHYHMQSYHYWLFDNYFFYKSAAQNFRGIWYDRQHHAIYPVYDMDGITEFYHYMGTSIEQHPYEAKKYGDNAYITCSDDGDTIYKTTFTDDGRASVLQSSSVKQMMKNTGLGAQTIAKVRLSEDLQFVCAAFMTSSEARYYKYAYASFNPQDLTVTYSGQHIFSWGGSAPTSSFIMYPLSNYKVVVGTSDYAIYDMITGTKIYTPTSASTSELPSLYCWSSNDTNYVIAYAKEIRGYPSSTTAEYLIYPSHFYTENDKYYGIASSTLNIGDVGEAQLLFSEGGAAT